MENKNISWRVRLARLLKSRWFRGVVSIGLILAILARLDLHQLAETLSRVKPSLLLLGIIIFLVCNMASVLKWQIIVRAQTQGLARGTISYFYLTSIFYMGLFFSNFLPTNFGGDFVRIWKLSKFTGGPVLAAGSVVADRATSTFALLFIALIPAVAELKMLGRGVALLVISMFVLFVLIMLLFSSERVAIRLSGFPVLRSDPFGFRKHLKSLFYSLHGLRRKPAILTKIILISFIYQGLHIITIYVLGLSLDIHISPLYYFLFIPVVLAVGMIPVSLNGLGVREGAWVLLFSQVGVPSAEAFSMSLLTFMVLAFVSLSGGVFYLADRTAPEPEGET